MGKEGALVGFWAGSMSLPFGVKAKQIGINKEEGLAFVQYMQRIESKDKINRGLGYVRSM